MIPPAQEGSTRTAHIVVNNLLCRTETKRPGASGSSAPVEAANAAQFAMPYLICS